MISIEHVTMIYEARGERTVALDDVSLTVAPHEFVTIVGPSGCGKSTLLYLVAGFFPATAGTIRIDGRPVAGPSQERGIVFQKYSLFPWRTVRGNVAYGLEEQGLPRAEREETVRRYLRMVHLEAFAGRYPRELSGGMQQRVALAQTLAYGPTVLLMDEPFGALDAQTRKLMQAELVRLWQTEKKTVLFVTHDVEEAVFLGSAVVVMSARPGRVKEIARPPTPFWEMGDTCLIDPRFAAMKMAIWQSVREEVERARAAEEP